MDRPTGSRRAAILALAASLAVSAPTLLYAPSALADTSQPLSGAAAAQIKFKAIKIDVSALAGKGLAPEASWLAQDLPGLLHAAFANHLAPGAAAAPTLVVRIDGVFIGESGGGGTQPFGGSAARDNIEGAAMIVASNGRPIATYPLFTTLLAYTGGSAREMDTVRGRVADLASSFAQWLPGQMGL